MNLAGLSPAPTYTATAKAQGGALAPPPHQFFWPTVSRRWRWLLALNPMSAVVEAFKWGTLGVGHLTVGGVTTSLAMMALTLVTGIWFFNREETASIEKL